MAMPLTVRDKREKETRTTEQTYERLSFFFFLRWLHGEITGRLSRSSGPAQ